MGILQASGGAVSQSGNTFSLGVGGKGGAGGLGPAGQHGQPGADGLRAEFLEVAPDTF
jgi:hypothetical protein